MSRFLLRLGELSLRGKNRYIYEDALVDAISAKLGDIHHRFEKRVDRILLGVPDEYDKKAEGALASSFGLAGFARVVECAKDIDSIRETVLRLTGRSALAGGAASFCVRVRRIDKSFFPNSEELAAIIGTDIHATNPALTVDLKGAAHTVTVEIRDRAYVYMDDIPGLRGLPTGTQGRGLVLLSAGIDSPVAFYQMAARGMRLDALYFEGGLYSAPEAVQKVRRLCRVLARTHGPFTLYSLNVQSAIDVVAREAPKREHTILHRRLMMHTAERLARQERHQALITGDSLGQVASQSVESIDSVGSGLSMPILRPLIGLDKEWIIRRARDIGTFAISKEPANDFCSLVAGKNPVTRPKRGRIARLYEEIHLDTLSRRIVADSVREGIVPG